MNALGRIARKPLLVLGALVAALVLLQVVERLVRGPGATWTPPANTEESPFLRPSVERVDERTIMVEAGIIDRSRFRFGDEDGVEYVDAMQACFESEIERDFTEDPTTSRREMRNRLQRITRQCMETTVIDPPADG